MKKFLDLKRSIVDSKNQPTLIQTYLDTIRSSCYKLATPYISPRPSSAESPNQTKANANVQNIDKNIQSCPTQLLKQTNEVALPSHNKGSNSKNKKMTYRYNISELMQSTNESDSSETIIKNIQHSPRSPQQTPKAISNQIEQIFQTLQSNCKTQSKQGQVYKSQKQIIQAIMLNLNLLNKKKQYHQSIKLIKNIIQGMGETLNDSLVYHSQIKNTDYIMQTPEQDIGSSRENSHFKSCMQAEEKGALENGTTNNGKDLAIKIDWNKSSQDSEKKVDKKIKILRKQADRENAKIDGSDEPLIIKYTVHRNPYKSSEGSSIYIEDSQNQQLFQQEYEDGEETQEQLDDTMKSQDLNKWKEDQLYEISEHEEEEQDPKSSLNSSMVPEETIQFKKILYMLDSGSTSKKIPQPQLRQIDIMRKASHNESRSSHNSSNRSIKKLFAEQDRKQNQKSVEYQHQQRSSNAGDSSPWANTNSYKSSLRSSNSNTHTNSNSSLKFKNSKMIKQAEVNEFNKNDKSKDLRNIVDMLNKKYNRTIKLTKYNNQYQN